MRAPSNAYRGFTLIELIAVIVIIAIIAAVAIPRETAAMPFAERGYADAVAANLRRARLVAMTTGCAVQFTINGNGYLAQQRGPGPNNHCAAAGPWATTVFNGAEPAAVALGANRQVLFLNDGTASAPVTIDIGSRQVLVESSGLVSGP